jgi:hypothetical protein
MNTNQREKTTTASRYIIRDREAGNFIDEYSSMNKAQEALNRFEKSDKKEGIFVPNFYEIIIKNENKELEKTQEKNKRILTQDQKDKIKAWQLAHKDKLKEYAARYNAKKLAAQIQEKVKQ